MTFKATMSCDQPGCQIFITADLDYVEFQRRSGGWKSEDTPGGTRYTCPNHGENIPTAEERDLAEASMDLLRALVLLDDRGYYTMCNPATEPGGGALLHIHPYEYEEHEGPRAVITQSAHSFRVEIHDAEGTVLHDEDSEVWE